MPLDMMSLGAHVRRHDHDGVLEVDDSAVVVGEVSLIEHLQQDVEDVRVCLLDFIEQHHTSTASGASVLVSVPESS